MTLSNIQTLILAAAAQQPDGIARPPASLQPAPRAAVAKALLRAGLPLSGPGPGPTPWWRGCWRGPRLDVPVRARTRRLVAPQWDPRPGHFGPRRNRLKWRHRLYGSSHAVCMRRRWTKNVVPDRD